MNFVYWFIYIYIFFFWLLSLCKIESNVTTANNKCERTKLKYERVSKILVNVKAGIEHIYEKLEFFKVNYLYKYKYK